MRETLQCLVKQFDKTMIPETILDKYGSKKLLLNKDQIIFHQGTEANYYYQVLGGEVKMAHYNDEGQEFIQGIFTSESSFGEPALFGEFPYPCSAVTTKDSIIAKLKAPKFFKLLEENFEIHKKFNRELSKRLHYKGIILNEISCYPPAHRIQTVLKYIQKQNGIDNKSYEVPFTRQQIAGMTGLRVETVIKTIKKLEAKKYLRLKNHKIILE